MDDAADPLTTSEKVRVVLRFAMLPPCMAALLHWPAGDWRWPEAWAEIAALMAASAIASVWMSRNHPDLLRERMKGTFQESQPARDTAIVVALSVVMLAVFPVAALDYRFDWLMLGSGYKLMGWVLFGAAMWVLWDVIKTNAFLSRSIVIQEEQTVVDTRLYGLVRHPMYFGVVLMLTGMVMILGSVVAHALNVVAVLGLYVRAWSEEELLRKNLSGYEDYMTRVRKRLIPYVL